MVQNGIFKISKTIMHREIDDWYQSKHSRMFVIQVIDVIFKIGVIFRNAAQKIFGPWGERITLDGSFGVLGSEGTEKIGYQFGNGNMPTRRFGLCGRNEFFRNMKNELGHVSILLDVARFARCFGGIFRHAVQPCSQRGKDSSMDC